MSGPADPICAVCGEPKSAHAKRSADWRDTPGCSGHYPPDALLLIRERVRRQAETGHIYDGLETATADRAELLKYLDTEREMHAAWRKRATEAESALQQAISKGTVR